jgi:hypothetical protein
MWLNKYTIAILLSVALWSLAIVPASAQRIVSPVESNDLPMEIIAKQIEKARLDTIATDTVSETKPIHNAPLLGGLLITADISAPVMNLLGTQYGSYEFGVELDLYHRFFPVVELGIGTARYTPLDNNYTFNCAPSLYGRVGVNYNFFYNNGSESFVGIGLRYGLTSFKYNWDNITLSDSYWDSSIVTSTPQETAFAHWGEIAVVLRVQIYKNFYMGWSGRYRLLIDCESSQYGKPYYIPGFGPQEGGFGFTYTVGYNIPFGNKEQEKDIVEL